jgi:hypothetical protein
LNYVLRDKDNDAGLRNKRIGRAKGVHARMQIKIKELFLRSHPRYKKGTVYVERIIM